MLNKVSSFWSFAATLAWLIYRDADYAEHISKSEKSALIFLFSHNSPVTYKNQTLPIQIDIFDAEIELIDALQRALIQASGFKNTSKIRDAIPSFEWIENEFLYQPDMAYYMPEGYEEPITAWYGLKFPTSDLFKLWPNIPSTKETNYLAHNNGIAKIKNDAFLQLDGEWLVKIGHESARIKDSLGMQYLHYLLMKQDKSISVLELDQAISKTSDEDLKGHIEERDEFSISSEPNQDLEATDLQSIREYKTELHKLKMQLDDAIEIGDTDKQHTLNDSISELVDHLSKVTNIKGKPRKTNSYADKCRQRIQKAISRAIKEITTKLPVLTRHFTNNPSTGFNLQYISDPKIKWQLTP